MARDEKFLSRWSRLKQEEREAAAVGSNAPAAPPAEPPKPVAVAPSVEGRDEAKKESEPALPSIESLTKDSDFSAFMKVGVPDALRNRALRKLWETDPSLYAHDGLTDYGADYAKIMRDGESLAETAYKIGRGFLEKGELPWEKEEEEAEKAARAAREVAAATPVDAPAAATENAQKRKG